MAVKFYMDVHVKRAVTEGLRRRGVDVLTAQKVKRGIASDREHIETAMRLGRVIFTKDADFLRLHAVGVEHAGIVYCHQRTSIAEMLNGLMLVYEIMSQEQMVNQIQFI